MVMMLNGIYNTISTDVLCNSSEIMTESTYLIKIEMIDGTSQLVNITKEQAIALGIEFPEATLESNQNEDIDVESVNITLNPVDNTAANISYNQIKVPTSTQKTRYNYKVIQPEDLNLRPNIPVPSLALPRGRPKKRPPDEVVEPKPPPKMIKTARTRSGRITRPPIHMEKDFKKIITEENIRDQHTINNKDLSTVEFSPLKTNSNNPQEPEIIVEPQKKKKRAIPSQYRCCVCQKAYLGRNRMAQHLKKHPDHGIPSHLTTEDCEVWSFLIEVALRAKEGHKGSKFCKEMINLVKNARTLVKYFFKPAKEAKAEYKVDGFLADVLNIKIGDYRFNENELCKDVSIFSFLEFFDDNFTNNIIKFDADTSPVEKGIDNIIPLDNGLIELKKNEVVDSTPIETNVELNHKANIDLHFGSDIMDVIKENSSKSDIKIFCEQNGFNSVNANDKETDFNNIIDAIDCDKSLTNGKVKNDFIFFECHTDYISETKNVINSSNNDPTLNVINVLHNRNGITDTPLFNCTDVYVDKMRRTETNKSNNSHKGYDITNVINHNDAGNKNSDFNHLYDCHTIYDSNTKKDNVKTKERNQENLQESIDNKMLSRKETKNDFSNLFDGFMYNDHKSLNRVNVDNTLTISNEKNKTNALLDNTSQNEKSKGFELFDCSVYIDKDVENKTDHTKKDTSKNDKIFSNPLDIMESSHDNTKKDFDKLFEYSTNTNKNKPADEIHKNYDTNILTVINNHKIVVESESKDNFSDIFSCHKNYDIYLNDSRLKSIENNHKQNCNNSNDLNLILKENKTNKIDFNDSFHKAFNSESKNQSKEVDIFRNTIQNILSIGASDEHMINLLAGNHRNEVESRKELPQDTHVKVVGKSRNEQSSQSATKNLFQTKSDQFTLVNHQKVVPKKDDDFDLHKLHLLPDELMLPEGGHVTNILDTSTNSDDIMNVDQFVNERFKKLTEVDVEMPNTTLSLDLPSLDCFNFHTD